MRILSVVALTALGAAISACTLSPPAIEKTWTASSDYMAHGTLHGARAFNYGRVAVIELPEPKTAIVHDAYGRVVAPEKMGTFLRVPVMSKFSVTSGGRTATFTAPVETKVYAAPTVAAAPAVILQEFTASTAEAGDSELRELLRIAETQLAEAREILRKSPSNTAQLTMRLNAAEEAITKAATAIIRVGVSFNQTDFAPSAEMAKVLIEGAKAASAVHVRGYTDSRIAGPLDAQVALARAQAAHKFLLDAGVAAEKIRVEAFAAGHHVVPNVGAGREVNRRVEIEFKNERIAKLNSYSVKLEPSYAKK